MVLVVHNFPTVTSAYQFEWALQHPEKTRRLKDVEDTKKKRLETTLQYLVRDGCIIFALTTALMAANLIMVIMNPSLE